MDILEQVSKTIKERKLLKKRDSVLVALSGGPDSVALLHLLLNIREKYNLNIAAAHLDHAIRAGSSKDREFCRKLCKRLKIKLYSRRTDVEALARKEKMTIEEAGRKARYDYFQSICSKYGYNKIATGHTSDDNAETVLFNMARGSGLRGLSGIPVKRGNIIRPLIEIEKAELIYWLTTNKIKFRTDPTNRSIKYTRNRIRQKVIPELKQINPELMKSLGRLSRNVAEDLELIDSLAVLSYNDALMSEGNSKIVLDLRKLEKYDASLRKKAVVEAFFRLIGAKFSPSFDLLARADETINGRSGSRTPLGKNIWIEKSQGKISVFKAGDAISILIPIVVPSVTKIPGSGWILETRVLNKKEVKSLKTKPSAAFLDNKKVIDPVVRFRRKGDRIRPFGMRGAKLVSDLLIDRKIPKFERDEVPLVISKNRIAWVGGVAISDDFKVGPSTREILRLELWKH